MKELRNVIRKYTIIISSISVIVVICNSAMPLVVKSVADLLINKNFDLVRQKLLVYIILIVLILGAEYASKVFNAKFKTKLTVLFRRLYVTGVLQHDGKFENPQELYSVFNNEMQSVIEDYYLLIPSVFFQGLSILWYTAVLCFLNKWVAFFIVLTNIITVLIPYAFEKNLQYLKERNLAGMRKLNVLFHDIVEGMATINDYLLHRKIFDRIEEKSLEQQDIAYRYNLKVALLQVLIGLVQYSSLFLVVFLLTQSIIRGESTVGTFLAVFQLSDFLVGPIISFSGELISISATREVKRELFEWMSDNKFYEHSPCDITGISYEGVSFSYDDKQLFENITCSFEFPKKYLIVGANGSGKSTLLKLMFGELKNYEGSIKIDGKDIRQYPNLVRNISYVRQKPYLFNDSIIHNITLFQELDPEEVEQMLQKVHLDSELLKNRDGEVNELNLSISGGEKQKIVIARALLQKKPFLVLDEAMSNMDIDSVEKIEKMILEDRNIGFIHIAHNYSGKNIEGYDAIFEVGRKGIIASYR